MSAQRGAAPVGHLSDLGAIEAAAVLYLRLWCDGSDAQAQVRRDFDIALGAPQGQAAAIAFQGLCDLCTRHARRPLMRHKLTCTCLGADESCFATFIAAAAEGAREDALMMACLIVRPDVAPLLADLAARFGMALMRMNLGPVTPHSHPPATLH